MSYTVQTWTDNVTKVDAEHLNHMEQGIADGQSHGDIFYGACSTAYGTTTKAVTCDDFEELFTGAHILVDFSNCTTVESPSLNVNQTGAKNIYLNGAVASSSNPFRWGAGAKIPFVYDGTGWVPVGYANGFTGTCATSASTAAKTTSSDGYVLTNGTSITVQMTYANTSSTPTLNVSSTGAYTITGYTGWKAGDYVTFVFYVTYYVAQGVNLDDLTAAVETAQSTADAAQSAANAAQTAADSAASAANAAQSTADAAQSAAQTAQTALEDISATLTQMQAQIDDLDARVTALESGDVPVYDNYFAVYSADDSSFTFYGDDTLPTAGTQYNGKTATDVYTGVEDTGTSNPPWYDKYSTPTKVVFDKSFSGCRPKSCYAWFMDWYHDGAPDLRYLNTSECANMGYMFEYWNRWSWRTSLTALDVSGFDTGKVTDMVYIFCGLEAITSLDVSGFDTSAVTNMNSMFAYCSGLTALDVSRFDTSAVTNMNSMFYYCSGLTTLDVSRLDTSAVTNMNSMFAYCSGLTTIYSDDAKFVTTKVTSSSNRNYMFTNCTKLVGGNGTAYDSSKVTAGMAHVDTASNPGYFTAK